MLFFDTCWCCLARVWKMCLCGAPFSISISCCVTWEDSTLCCLCSYCSTQRTKKRTKLMSLYLMFKVLHNVWRVFKQHKIGTTFRDLRTKSVKSWSIRSIKSAKKKNVEWYIKYPARTVTVFLLERRVESWSSELQHTERIVRHHPNLESVHSKKKCYP